MTIKKLMNVAVAELKTNEVIEAQSISNMLAGCGIENGWGSCGTDKELTNDDSADER